MKIYEAIKALISSSNRSMTAFARRCGMTRQQLSATITKERGITVDTLLTLASGAGYRIFLVPDEYPKPRQSIEIDSH